ncbi:MAG: SCO family protein [Halobacteriovoraceae bacterium]|nr:SCO family protein [Halobacteriovoraceae bacterium]
MDQAINSDVYIRKNNFIERLVLKKWFWVLACVFFFGYPILRSLNRDLPPELPVLYKIPEFRLFDENGKVFTSHDLQGKPYIANFHFTSCPTICKETMEQTQIVQKRMKGLGTNIQIVSFTVDPEVDTPKKLFKHARELKANPFIWKFLTGSEEELKKVVVDGFKAAMGEKTNDNMYDIAHSSRFFLVDEKGQLRALYEMKKESINKMMIDIGLLVNRLYQSGKL